MRNAKTQSQLVIVALVAVILILACGPTTTATPTVDQNAVVTSVQQTMIAHTLAALEANQQSSGEQQQQPAPTLTHTIAVTTETPTLTLEPSYTPTSSVPMVSVSVDTNCRFGPGKDYELLGALLVGEQAEIVARDPSGFYWYIKNPDRSGFCWLWANYATTTGNTASLAVFTPPPTPTFTATPTPDIDFNVTFHEIDGCVGWEIEFRITNTGSVIFQSVSTVVTDNKTAQTVNTSADKFEERNGCLVAGTYSDLDPGDTGYTVGGILNNNPVGHNLDASVQLCTDLGLGGTCVTKNFSFTP